MLTTVTGGALAVFSLAGLLLDPLRADAASDARERVLEARIRALEHRLEEMEAKLEGRRHLRSSKPTQMPALPNAAAESPNNAPVGSTHAGSEGTGTPVAPTRPGIEARGAAETPQETFVFRENSVTLKPRHFEVFTEADYIRANGLLQTDRAVSSATSVRLGILDSLEVNATIPAFTSTRTRGTGPFRTQSKQISGLGDVLLQANARLHEQTAETPGVVLSLGALFPTGVQPYGFNTYQPNPSLPGYNPNPTDLNAAYLSRGAWGLVTNLQFYKTVDPLILFLGTGIRYLFPQAVQGHPVQGGAIYNYNMGLSFAISEKSTLGLQILGSYENKLSVDRRLVPQSELEPVSIRVSLIQRIFPDTWIESALGAGLTQDAPNLDIGFGVRHRF